MLSKSQVSFIKSLHQKKFRKQHGLFIAEGIKSVNDLIASGFHCHSIYVTPEISSLLNVRDTNIKLFEVNNVEIDKISTLQTPQGILAVLFIPSQDQFNPLQLKGKFSLALDGIQDPGNLGTIIRTADWFGISQIFCSPNTAELYNPKTVQASMGSLGNVTVSYMELASLFQKTNIPSYGAMLEGENIYKIDWGPEGIIVLGSEGKGISAEVAKLVTKSVTIPGKGKAESLNVAVSAAVFCSEITR